MCTKKKLVDLYEEVKKLEVLAEEYANGKKS